MEKQHGSKVGNGVVGLAGIGIGAGFGLSARSDADTAKSLCDGNQCATQRGVDAAEDASRKATISTVSFVAGGALTALGTILLFAGSSDSGPERDSASVQLAPYAGPGSFGTQLSGRF